MLLDRQFCAGRHNTWYVWLPVTAVVAFAAAAAAWSSHIQEAAAHNRLSSATYRRLNLGVMYQSIVFAVLAIRERALLSSTALG